jgi:undecaprenyl diphosphate synthase
MATINLETFTTEERALIETLALDRLPRHIALIMDGNGRWATGQGLPRVLGHHAGVASVRRTVTACLALDIRYLTLYSFSTENWARPDEEVQALMSLIEQQFRLEVEALHQQNVRIRHLGREQGLPASLRQTLHDVQSMTQENTALTVQFAINYSGRAELCDAARRLAARAVAGTLTPASITEEDFAAALYNPDVPDPDLLIRTAGEQRVSNYLLWQIAYAEFWVTADLWPDFRASHLLCAIQAYQHRQRKFGGGVTS